MKIGEGKGFMGISLREVFRVYIALHRKEGFLGVFIEAPKKEKPDFITVIFYTDSHTTLERLKGNLKKLRESLSSLGLEVRKLEVLGRKEEDFSGLMSEELGSGLFNLRV
ncbi:MAG TPA: flagellar hook-length control protein FliK [Aquificaceae bacterium]|nr:flagellar hook-length control protein FliK [Aquificaceae bacterium]